MLVSTLVWQEAGAQVKVTKMNKGLHWPMQPNQGQGQQDPGTRGFSVAPSLFLTLV